MCNPGRLRKTRPENRKSSLIERVAFPVSFPVRHRVCGPQPGDHSPETGNTGKLSLFSVTGLSLKLGDIYRVAPPVVEIAPSTLAPRVAQKQADVSIDNDVTAVLIGSDFGPLWFAFNDRFQSGDDIPVFFASELPFLREMTSAELHRRYEEKRALGGGWIRARIKSMLVGHLEPMPCDSVPLIRTKNFNERN